MTEFNTQVGGGKYRLQFETDDKEKFMIMQDGARHLVDYQMTKTNADQIRAMSDEELADFINNHNICNIRTSYECKISYCGICSQCVLDWLRQPAEVADGK